MIKRRIRNHPNIRCRRCKRAPGQQGPAATDCFRQAFTLARQTDNNGMTVVFLCHGFAAMNGKTLTVHAWVEQQIGDQIVVFDNTLNKYRRNGDEYYRHFGVTGVVRYEPQQATILVIQSHHCGPWHASLRPLFDLDHQSLL